MKLCILDDAYDDSTSPLKDVDIPSDVERYLGDYHYEHHFLTKRTAVRQVTELAGRDFDVFVNLCDGAWDEDRPGIEVVQTLEQLNVPFTGADARFYDPSRQTMKKVAHYYGIPTPAAVFASGDDGIEKAVRTLEFPLITKHPNSYSSIGMTKRSRVESAAALRREASRMINEFGSVLIEEFIEGREYNVLVAENPDDPLDPIAYEPVEFRFPEGESFKHFDMKWKEYGDMVSVSCDDESLAVRLKEMASRFFVGLKGTGYGRCDIRVDKDGRPFMLEINPNCGIFYPPHAEGSADLILSIDPAGHSEFVRTIIRSARNRVAPSPTWSLELDEERSFGLYAKSNLEEGAVIYEYEENHHVLVSRSRVQRDWDDRKKDWFGRYAYPLTDEIYVMWSDDPEDWKPINHSCDPNAWLDGLNLVARRPIAAGEQITMDYATFCNEVMEPFECACGSVLCRDVIRGDDYLQPFVDRYGDHVSDYVKNKRKTLAWEVEVTAEDLEVHIWNGQSGVYAAREFEPGEHVMRVSGDVGPSSSRYSIQISEDRHVHPSGPETPWMYLNHSCRPNLAFDPESRHFVALEVISSGQQLTFNYLTTEWDMAEAFECQCGAERCSGLIAGFKHLDDASKEHLFEDVMPHIRGLSEDYRMDEQHGPANVK